MRKENQMNQYRGLPNGKTVHLVNIVRSEASGRQALWCGPEWEGMVDLPGIPITKQLCKNCRRFSGFPRTPAEWLDSLTFSVG